MYLWTSRRSLIICDTLRQSWRIVSLVGWIWLVSLQLSYFYVQCLGTCMIVVFLMNLRFVLSCVMVTSVGAPCFCSLWGLDLPLKTMFFTISTVPCSLCLLQVIYDLSAHCLYKITSTPSIKKTCYNFRTVKVNYLGAPINWCLLVSFAAWLKGHMQPRLVITGVHACMWLEEREVDLMYVGSTESLSV
jgi:hypothetical protein